MKSIIQYSLQKILGFQHYLFLFSLYSSFKIDFFKQDKEFSYFVDCIKKFEGNTIIDIGANIGATVSVMSKRYPNYQIVGFEPSAINYSILNAVAKFKSLKNTRFFPFAIGEVNKKVELATPVYNGVIKHGLSHILDTSYKDNSITRVENCQMKSLDSVLIDYPVQQLCAIKIDVENYEYHVLKGANETIQKHRPLIFAELWDNHKKRDCIDLMHQLGYKTKVLVGNDLVNYDNHVSLNYFFIPTEKSDI
jgi:FkbM family methyltransferase